MGPGRRLHVLLGLALALAVDVAVAAPRILCLGDSLTEGLGVAREAAWPALLSPTRYDRPSSGFGACCAWPRAARRLSETETVVGRIPVQRLICEGVAGPQPRSNE